MPVTMSKGDVDAFRKVVERLQNPVCMVRIVMSLMVSTPREPATAEDAPAPVASTPATSVATIEDHDEEEGWEARKPLSDGKGKDKRCTATNALSVVQKHWYSRMSGERGGRIFANRGGGAY